MTVTLRQSGQMMRRYLSQSGEDLKTAPRIFVRSEAVQKQMLLLRQKIIEDLRVSKKAGDSYSSDTFYMGDPKFFDSFVGLYFGRITAIPGKATRRGLTILWRAECPWEWPSYVSLFEKYGKHHAQCFPIPNAMSVVLGSSHSLWIDDGLGGHLATLGIAKPFLVWSEWTEEIDTRQ